MKAQLLSEIISVISTCVVIAVSVIIKLVGEAVISLIEEKRNEIIGRTGVCKYNQERTIAADIWNIIDEYFRINKITDDVINKKINMFNEELKNRIPYLTDEQIAFLRQVIAGEINKGRGILSSAAEKDNTK